MSPSSTASDRSDAATAALDDAARRTGPGRRRRADARGTEGLGGTLAKIVLLGLVDAFAAFLLFQLAAAGDWVVFALTLAVTIGINWIYLRRGGLPAKYLAPGLFFLMLFQVFVVVYSSYVAFTNYGAGHNSDKAAAIEIIQRSSSIRVPDSPVYDITVLEEGGDLYLLTLRDGEPVLGGADQELEPVEAQMQDGQPVGVEGYTTLRFGDLLQRQDQVTRLKVPLSDDAADGTLETRDGSRGYVYAPRLKYDEARDTFTDLESGVEYRDNGEGQFQADDGSTLQTGWRVFVGLDNFTRAFTDPELRDPLLRVTVWTFAFAFLSVATTFAVGLLLAIAFNRSDMRGKKVYRVMMILPYAFPAFLSGLVWAGLLNPEFGFVNTVFFGGADIPWLTDPWLARLSVLVVNLWLGFPYMFLVTTGALQSLPEDVDEAARMDGAGPWRIFRSIKLPLLLVSVAPLLISSFAFNFNNFNIIYMLTGGGPRFPDAGSNIGATDLLITVVYKTAFSGVGRDYGLASALSIVIFLIVATISAISFRQTKALEEIDK
ncbi:ABC transporter permease subunit [Micrococcus sp. KRD096]|uniref:ABC transporter permease subunit n=1 Tax=Micrococcus sp. KRD096 TaxID=2729721 RepID=UPI0019D11AEB|nr:ABC transporter permease subunit [Micrococcus sp. KRD096]